MDNRVADVQFRKMTETPVSRLIISLGIPTIVSMLITSIYNLVDTYFVSKIGTSASGAVGVVFGLMAIIQAFGFMFGHGAGSIISRRLGARDTEGATRFASTSFALSIEVGTFIALVGMIFLNPLMYLLGSTPTILPYARQYGFFILLSSPFLAASCVMNNILRYEGKAMLAMIGLATGGVLNIIGDPILMFGCGMGVVGAGLSTAISQIISFFILLYMFLSGKTTSRLSFRNISHRFRDIFEIVSVGFPSMIRQGLNSISTMMLNNAAAVYGDAAVAAMSIVNRVSFFIFAVGLGIGQGFQPVAAFNYGAGLLKRVRRGVIFTATSCEAFLGLLAILGFIFSEQIVTLFRNDPAVIEIGTFALRCQCIACFFQPIAVTTNMLFQSIGKSGIASLLSAMRSGIFFIPVILILPNVYGLTGVQISQTIADILSCLMSLPFIISFMRTLQNDRRV